MCRNHQCFRSAALGIALLGAICCGSDVLQPQAFCEQLPKYVCDDLFDTSCSLTGMSREDVRYATRQDCEVAERQACQDLVDDSSLHFDETKAFECIDEISKATCEEASRSAFHDCDHVFDAIERPVSEQG